MPAGMVTGLRGADLGVPDVAAHARFYTEVWRLTVAAERNGSVYLRGSGAYHHILALHPRDRPGLLCINLAARSRAAVDRLHRRVESLVERLARAEADDEEEAAGPKGP